MAGLELAIFLPSPLECWVYKHTQPHLTEIEPRWASNLRYSYLILFSYLITRVYHHSQQFLKKLKIHLLPSIVAHAYHPSNVGGVKKRMTTVQAGLGKNVRPYLKNN
jgi:hypothetical protein